MTLSPCRGGDVFLPLARMGTTQAQSLRCLLPHTCGRRDPPDRLPTSDRSRTRQSRRQATVAYGQPSFAAHPATRQTAEPVGQDQATATSSAASSYPSPTWAQQKIKSGLLSHTCGRRDPMVNTCPHAPGLGHWHRLVQCPSHMDSFVLHGRTSHPTQAKTRGLRKSGTEIHAKVSAAC